MKQLFEEIIDTKIHAIHFLQTNGVIPNTKICPGPWINGKRRGKCGQPMVLKEVKDRKDNITWRCRKVHKTMVGDKEYIRKDVKVTVREGTWLQNVNLTLEEIILILYCWANNYTNEQIEHEVGCSDKTVSKWCHFLRQSCFAHVLDCSEPIGGPGIEVEIDESKFGRRKYYQGRHVEGKWIFGGRETRNKKKIFMVPVDDRSKATLIPIIQERILVGSTIQSDKWAAYRGLNKLGYKHITVNHSKHFKDPKTGACTNRIESDWRHAKVSMPRYGVKKGQHATYLAEFMWRRKFSDDDPFKTIIEQLNYHYDKQYFKKLP